VNDNTFVQPFPGRLSAVLPRHADPELSKDMDLFEVEERSAIETVEVTVENEGQLNINADDLMEVDDAFEAVDEIEDEKSTTPMQSPPRNSVGNFSLRSNDEYLFHDSDSEDELASASPRYSPVPLRSYKHSSSEFTVPATPTRFVPIGKTPGTQHTIARDTGVKIGFTPLARQLTDWMAASPDKSTDEHKLDEEEQFVVQESVEINDVLGEEAVQQSPLATNFFEDEMTIRDEIAAAENDVVDIIEFAPAELDDEDLALAAEADEISLLEPEEQAEEFAGVLNVAVSSSRALSEASQEYGDENSIPMDFSLPIDPALLALDAQTHVPAIVTPTISTPVRTSSERVIHTTSKVPLKPAAEDSPVKFSLKRSATVSRLPVQRHAPPPPAARTPSRLQESANTTPARSSNWSSAATPTRTPRADLNNQVLKGAVVFVDVHTTEGADASAVFVDLLGQMGAKCVRSWSWNPNGRANSNSPPSDGEAAVQSSQKIGITHVVFKDGGKKTMEKVRESKGVVLCVGVGWVLE
jgi:hypothetical protein